MPLAAQSHSKMHAAFFLGALLPRLQQAALPKPVRPDVLFVLVDGTDFSGLHAPQLRLYY